MFLPFFAGVSPLDYLLDMGGDRFRIFLQSAILLPAPISVGSFLQIVTRRFDSLVASIAYAFAFGASALWLAFLLLLTWFDPPASWADVVDLLIVYVPSLVFLIGGCLFLIRNWKCGVRHAQNAINAMQVTCASVAVFHLIGWSGGNITGLDAGGHVAIFAAFVYVAHVVLAPKLT